MIRHLTLTLLNLIFLTSLWGQDPQFSQIQSVPLYLNPAFSGLNEGARYTMNYRRQYAGVTGGYSSFGASADYNLFQANSGLGFSLFKDVAGVTKLSYTTGAVYFSHRIRLDRYKWVNAGMKVGFVSRTIDINSMLFGDQIARDGASATVEPNLLGRATNFDFGFGLAYYDNDYWFGLSLDHLLEPELTLMEGGSAPMPMRLSIHGGVVVYKKGNYRSLEQVKLVGQYKKEAKWDQIDLGVYYHVEKIYGGLMYRGIPFKQYRRGIPGHDAIAAIVGMKFDTGLKVGYSYDFTISTMGNQSGGSHEISVIFSQRKTYRKKIVVPPCMKF